MSNRHDASKILTVKLIRWSVIHGASLFCLTMVAWLLDALWMISLIGLISFSVLIWIASPHWTGQGIFGWANWVTAIRLGGVLILNLVFTKVTSIWIIGISLILLIGDGVDGWLARRFNQDSEFGEYFDKETDAFFILVLSLSIVANQRLGSWILMVGLLRYVFVLILYFYQPKVDKENRSVRGRFIYLLIMVALLACFLPFPTIYTPLAIVATLSLVYSFAKDLRWIFIQE